MKKKIIICILAIMLVLFSVGGTLAVSVTHLDTLTYLRNLWIETAMNTFHHKWLATTFFSEETINDVMNKQVEGYELEENISQNDTGMINQTGIFAEKYSGKASGDTDYAGNVIYKVDEMQEIAISTVEGSTYCGKIAIIDEPSRVFIGHTAKKGKIGENICTFLNHYDAILGVNASGFADYNGVGDGGEIMGMSISEGNLWGTYRSDYNTIGFDENNKLHVGLIDDWTEYKIMNGCQFNPALIIDGEKQIEGTAGWGMQPRTAIGQTEDGTVLILTIDGRKPGHSIGATMEDCANELLKYGAVTAAACDGGSSTIMAYDGNIITKCSSPQSGGRYLPNAFLVKRK